MAPKRTTRATRAPPVTPTPNETTTTVTEAQLQALIDQGVAAAMAEAEASRVRNGYNSNGSGPRPAQTARECSYSEFLKCKPWTSKATKRVVGPLGMDLRKWNCVRHPMWWPIVDDFSKLLCDVFQMFPEEVDNIEKYIGPKCHKCNIVGHLVRNCRRPTNDNTTKKQRGTKTSQKDNCYECGNQGHYKRDFPKRKNQSHKNQIGGTGAHRVVHTLRGGETDQDPNNKKDEIEA
ncbi:putative reverse transcriptase domain-containing protein [Tanacetum coccineum]|uniref:Reverse transcriptase domain-containing protein n=1 Tax=Tanacetum coccineum TaxID=301880 RepID=A0ABQ5EDI3_9ASTR